MNDKTNHWSVEVTRNHESILVIEMNGLHGKNDLSYDDLEQIRDCAEHLLGFAGKRSIHSVNRELGQVDRA